MIFLTVGLERFPFDRLVQTVDRLVAAGSIPGPVFGQIGYSRREPRHYPYCRFLPFSEMQARLREADVVICHGGVGTILMALGMGKIPLVVPRQAVLGEQLDDHQQDLAARLESAGRVLVADGEPSLLDQLARYERRNGGLPVPAGPPPEMETLVRFLQSTLRAGHGR